tara:strand:- start:4296 stop:4532 length:237 start_codon:yes stop_codon:yes gene_type:complete
MRHVRQEVTHDASRIANSDLYVGFGMDGSTRINGLTFHKDSTHRLVNSLSRTGTDSQRFAFPDDFFNQLTIATMVSDD